MAMPPPPIVELTELDVVPIEDEWAPADSIPLLELSGIMEMEEPEIGPAESSPTLVHPPVPIEPRLDDTKPKTAQPSPNAAAVAALSTVALGPTPSPDESIVAWTPRRSKFGWIMGTAAAASAAVVLLGWGLAPRQARAEPATASAETVVIRAEVPESSPELSVAEAPATPSDRPTARKLATIGHRQLGRGNLATAQDFFERALKAQPNNRMAHAGLGEILLRRKQPRRAVEHLRAAVKIEPRKADNRRLLGQAYLGMGRKDKAKAQLQKAVAYGDVPAQQLLMDL